MTPEEKAKWLVEKHEDVYQHYSTAVDHAIVTVETIIIDQTDVWENTMEYWEKVKQELNKLL